MEAMTRKELRRPNHISLTYTPLPDPSKRGNDSVCARCGQMVEWLADAASSDGINQRAASKYCPGYRKSNPGIR